MHLERGTPATAAGPCVTYEEVQRYLQKVGRTAELGVDTQADTHAAQKNRNTPNSEEKTASVTKNRTCVVKKKVRVLRAR